MRKRGGDEERVMKGPREVAGLLMAKGCRRCPLVPIDSEIPAPF